MSVVPALMYVSGVPDERRTIQVDFDDYMRSLRLEREHGAKRGHRATGLRPALVGGAR